MGCLQPGGDLLHPHRPGVLGSMAYVSCCTGEKAGQCQSETHWRGEVAGDRQTLPECTNIFLPVHKKITNFSVLLENKCFTFPVMVLATITLLTRVTVLSRVMVRQHQLFDDSINKCSHTLVILF